MTHEINIKEITEDNFEGITSELERNTIRLVSICQQCKHPLTEGVHYLIEGTDIQDGCNFNYRKCRLSGCFCHVILPHFNMPSFMENMK